MPILIFPLILALASVTADHAVAPVKAPPAAVHGEPPTFDPDRPPSWWLDKMQRPCARVNSRVSC